MGGGGGHIRIGGPPASPAGAATGAFQVGPGPAAWHTSDPPQDRPWSAPPAPESVRGRGRHGTAAHLFAVSCAGHRVCAEGSAGAGVDPPLSPGRACPHAAFIAFAVRCVFDFGI